MNFISKDTYKTSLVYLVFAYAFLCLPFLKIANIILIIYLLLLIPYIIKFWSEIANKKFIYLLLIALVSGIITWIITNIQVPEIATSEMRIGKIARVFLFVPLAIALAFDKKNIYTFWLISIVAAILLPWTSGSGFAEVLSAYNGLRTGFGRHIITMGIIYACIFVACLIYLQTASKLPYSIDKALAVILIIASFFGIYASQTRSIYLGLGLVYILLFFTVFILSFKSFNKYKSKILYFFAISILLSLVFYMLYYVGKMDWILSKTESESSVFWLFLSGEFDKIPRNSAGLRIHFWLDAYQWIIDRPLFGWGEKANRHLHAAAGNYFGNRFFITVHNDLLEILLAFGISGLLIISVAILTLMHQVNKAKNKKIISSDLHLYFYIFLVFFIFNGLFMSILFFRDTNYLWNIILSGYLALTVNSDLNTEEC